MSIQLPPYLDQKKPAAYDGWDDTTQQAWLDAQRKRRRENAAKHRATDPSKNRRNCMKWRRANRDAYRAYRNRSHKRDMEQPAKALRHSIRSRMLLAIKKDNGHKGAGVVEYIGCSMAELVSHIEGQFTGAMTWDNHGAVWHIDHIMPCSAFDHTDRGQIKRCWHFSNLRPTTVEDNLRKGPKITEPQYKLTI